MREKRGEVSGRVGRGEVRGMDVRAREGKGKEDGRKSKKEELQKTGRKDGREVEGKDGKKEENERIDERKEENELEMAGRREG